MLVNGRNRLKVFHTKVSHGVSLKLFRMNICDIVPESVGLFFNNIMQIIDELDPKYQEWSTVLA